MSHGRRVETGAGLKSKRVGGAGRWLAKTIISAEIVQYCIEQRLGSRTSSWHRPDTCMLHTDCHINTRKKPHIKRTGREVKPWSITVKFTLPQIRRQLIATTFILSVKKWVSRSWGSRRVALLSREPSNSTSVTKR